MKIKKISSIILFIVTFTAGIIYSVPCNALAYSASIWFETDIDEIYEGQEFKVYMNVSSDDTLGDFEGFVSYNDSVVEFISGPACVTKDSGNLKVNDKGASASWDTRQYVLTFKALKPGISLIQMIDAPIAYEYSEKQPMSVSSAVFQLEIMSAPESSASAILSLMKISPGTLTPSFSSDIFEYETIVSFDTKKLIISAIPKDLYAVVNVTGNSELIEGNNKVIVIVTSSNGEELTYIINVLRESEILTPTSPPSEEISDDKAEWRFDITSDNSTVFISGQYYYKLKEKTSDITIPEGYIKTRMVINKVPINIYAKEGEEAPEFYLMILENEAGITSLYRYDRVEKTIQRYAGLEETNAKSISRLEEQTLLQDASELLQYNQNVGGLSLLTGLSCSISVLLLVVVIVLIIKTIKNRNDELDY